MEYKLDFMGLPLKNAVIVAAGPWAGDARSIQKCIDAGAAAVITETIVMEESALFGPRVYYENEELLNISLYGHRPLEEWEEQVERIHKKGSFLICSIRGSSPSELAYIARRAEREMASAKQTGGVTPDAMRYLNRLSDLLYAMARMADAQGPGPAAPPADFGGGFLERALELCRRVLAEARRENLRVTAAVCDEGGSPTALLRDDGALLASVEIARDKAFTSAAMRMSTEELAGLCKPGGSLYGLQHTNGGRIVIFGGGVPLVEGNRLVGGFGVSGGTAEQDTNLANYALKVFSAGIREEYSR